MPCCNGSKHPLLALSPHFAASRARAQDLRRVPTLNAIVSTPRECIKGGAWPPKHTRAPGLHKGEGSIVIQSVRTTNLHWSLAEQVALHRTPRGKLTSNVASKAAGVTCDLLLGKPKIQGSKPWGCKHGGRSQELVSSVTVSCSNDEARA